MNAVLKFAPKTMPSPEHAVLKARIDELASRFVDFDIPLEREPNSHELDMIASFKLLVHAELETFIEDRIKYGLNQAIDNWKANRKVTQSLFGLLTRWYPFFEKEQNPLSNSIIRQDISDVLDRLHKKANDEIAGNNSIKKDAFARLCHSVGIYQDDLPVPLLAALEAYGKNRGDVAHQSVGRVQSLNDPRVEASYATQLVDLLADFDSLILEACA